jgi:hypothetical protein
MWDFVMDKSGAGAVFSENLGFPCQSTFHLFLHNHLQYHPSLAHYVRSGHSGNNTKNQIKNKYFNKKQNSVNCRHFYSNWKYKTTTLRLQLIKKETAKTDT